MFDGLPLLILFLLMPLKLNVVAFIFDSITHNLDKSAKQHFLESLHSLHHYLKLVSNN